MNDVISHKEESATHLKNSRVTSRLSSMALIRKSTAFLAYTIGLIFMWQLIVYFFKIEPFLLPSPGAVFVSIVSLPSYYIEHTFVTLREAGYGLLIGFALGFILALIIYYGGLLGRILNPLILSTQVFPKEALAPIFLVFLGFGIFPKIVIAALICFFPVVINTVKGLEATPSSFEKLMHVLGANKLQMFWYCRLRFAAPYILAALRMCATLSVIGAIVGEFVGSSAGLGHVIRSASSDIGIERVYASLIILGLMGWAFYAVSLFIEKVIFRRYTTGRSLLNH